MSKLEMSDLETSKLEMIAGYGVLTIFRLVVRLLSFPYYSRKLIWALSDPCEEEEEEEHMIEKRHFFNFNATRELRSDSNFAVSLRPKKNRSAQKRISGNDVQ